MDGESRHTRQFQMIEQDFMDFVGIVNRKICGQRMILQIVAVFLVIVLFAVVPSAVNDILPPKFWEDWEDLPFLVKHILIPFLTVLIFIYAFMALHGYLFKSAKISYLVPEGNFLRPKTTTIDEEGISEETEYGFSRTRWAGILAIENHEKLILFYVDRMSAYVIPKNGFENREAAEGFYRQALLYWEKARAPTSTKNPWFRPVSVPQNEEKIQDVRTP